MLFTKCLVNKIYLASDHGGLGLKMKIIEYLKEADIKIEDLGTNSSDSVDYPDFAHKLCKKVLRNKSSQGILFCGTGLGMSIAANRYKGIRAALCHDHFTAAMSKKHNDSNVLCIGGRTTGEETAKDIVKTWLESTFEEGRHTRRLGKIEI
ncbi:ribose 5-phosphate isomerase B [Candidatus Dojkabacteria bacterium]|nr:ribose 5-phosphate isomerase B [Candidatus Dojkabacteria bacterium]